MKINNEENEIKIENTEEVLHEENVEKVEKEELEMSSDTNNQEEATEIENEKNVAETSELVEKKVIKEEKKNIVLTKKQSTIFNIIAIICVALFGAAVAPKCLQNDTFYTIRIGEYIYNNGISDLTQDVFSWHEVPYTYPHWLYDLGIYLIYKVFGHPGIFISTMFFSALLSVSVYCLSNKKSKNKVVSLVVTMGAMYLIKSFIAARAQLVTFILFVWAVLAIEKFIETKKKRYALLLILIPLLITNLHCAVFPFYFILFLPYIGEYLLLVIEDRDLDLRLFKRIFKIKKKLTRKEEEKNACDRKISRVEFDISERVRKRKIIREKPFRIKVEKNHVILLLISVMALAVLTGFINPAGDGAFTYLYKTLQGNTTDSINEHLPLTLVENEEFAIAIIIFALVLIFTDTKIRLCDLLMLGGITILSFYSRRQVSMFAIFCGPILASLIASLVDKYDRETFKKIERWATGWFGATVVICLCIIGCTNLIKPTLRESYIDTVDYPVEEVDWMYDNLDVKNIKLYNEYNYGAYLLYRGVPVFIDSRCDLYSPEFNGTYNKETKRYDGQDIFSDALNIAGLAVDYKSKFEEYGVTHVILYENSKLAMILEDDSDYKTIHYGDNFTIFEKIATPESAQQAVEDVISSKQ